MENVFSDVDVPKLAENQAKLWEESLTEKKFIQFFEKYAK